MQLKLISPRFSDTILDSLYDGIYVVDLERRITFWNKAAERITGFTKAEVLGTQCFDNLLRHVDDRGKPLCVTACPLSHTMQDGLLRSAAVYLHHKTGHRLPVAVGVAPILDNKERIIGGVEIFRDNSTSMAALEQLRELRDLAYLDELTHIANRRYLNIFIASKLNEFERHGWPFGVIMADLDLFKQVNDTFGHQVGDAVLKMVAETLLKNCRSFDLVGRWGGEEFLCVLCNPIAENQLLAIAERLRDLVASTWVTLPDRSINGTISLGVTLAQPQDTLETLIQRADALLYRSKAAGRNCSTYE
jgi:diguanylate cyclase (GGDEF)-like protein/PAS domain S-box-containing protein